MIDFSCADFTFPVLTHEKSLKIIALMGFQKVCIGLFTDRSHLRPETELAVPEERGRALCRRAGEEGLSVSDVFLQSSLDFSELAINHPDKGIRKGQREVFERAITYTAAAGSRHFSGLPGVDFGADSRKICEEELAWRVARAKTCGITYCVEPHFGSIMQEPEQALSILESVPGLRLALDHSHFTFQGYSARDVAPLVPYAAQMHARGAAKGVMQSPVKDNQTDFATVMRQLKAADFSGTICMEYCYIKWENCNQTDNVSETVLLCRRLRELSAERS